ncbi:MAG: hypothetical protein DCC68_05360 [Planctomycetota bacterium]|nr:MAG: hypothetical protein DCC68_05360 [Planctomycetota bacterium]
MSAPVLVGAAATAGAGSSSVAVATFPNEEPNAGKVCAPAPTGAIGFPAGTLRPTGSAMGAGPGGIPVGEAYPGIGLGVPYAPGTAEAVPPQPMPAAMGAAVAFPQGGC